MAIPLMSLPGYQTGNTLLNFEPIQRALDQKIRMDQVQQEQAFRQQRADVDDQFRTRQLGMQEQQFKSQQQDREDARLTALKQRSAAIADLALNDTDPVRGQQQFMRLVQSDPRFNQGFQTLGIDPTKDWKRAAQTLIAEVQGYKSPTERARDAAQLDLIRAQTNAANASAVREDWAYDANSGLMYNKRTGEMRQQSGDGTPVVTKDTIERESALRKEFSGQQTIKDFQVVRDAYQNVTAAAAEPSAAGDLSLIFSFMKLLDPQSVVREQEFANAQNAAGVPDRVRNLYNRVMSGERLNEEQRKDFIKQANSQYQARERQYISLKNQYRGIATNARARPDQVLIDYGVAGGQPTPPPSAGTSTPIFKEGDRAMNAQGRIIEFDGQQWRPVN